LTDVDAGVGADALLLPFGERRARLDGSGAVVAGEHGGHALKEVSLVRFFRRARQIFEYMCMRIDETGTDDESFRIDHTHRLRFRPVAD